jgi:RimJ/RimL family protein N-acetyltransferase
VIREAPRIETDRLVLRHWRREDFDPLFAIQGHPDVYRHFGNQPPLREDSWRRMCAATGLWSLVGYGWWAIETRDEPRLVGTAGLLFPRRDMDPQYFDGPEMGWLVSSEVQGTGVAQEACRAVLDWAGRNLEPSPLWCMIVPENTPSIRLAERIGFQFQGTSVHLGTTVNVYRRQARG